MKLLSSFAVLTAAVSFAGCNRIPQHPFEERYRVFYANSQQVEFPAGTPLEKIAERFEPREAVAQAFEQLTQEGFELIGAEPIEWGRGAVLFRFRRPYSDAPVTDNVAPERFLGVYEAIQGPDGKEGTGVYYYFEPNGKGAYFIHAIGLDGDSMIETHWDGVQLVWDQGGSDQFAMLESDERYVRLILDPGGTNEPSERLQTFRLKRVETVRRETDDQRIARKTLYRLRPKRLGV